MFSVCMSPNKYNTNSFQMNYKVCEVRNFSVYYLCGTDAIVANILAHQVKKKHIHTYSTVNLIMVTSKY